MPKLAPADAPFELTLRDLRTANESKVRIVVLSPKLLQRSIELMRMQLIELNETSS